MQKTARVFTSRDSQIVHLPTGVRFTGSEVLVQQDPETGQVILTEKPQTWDAFFAARDAAAAAGELEEDLLDFEERKRQLPRPDPFLDLEE